MASAAVPIQKSLVHEGGYDPGFSVNGETYKGIDRLQQPTWPGWKIIDAYKRQKGLKKYAVIKDARLDALVLDFYKNKFWSVSRSGELSNQQFAENYFDFYFHKPAVAVAALKAAAGVSSLTEAITAANDNPAEVYKNFFALRIKHYSNQWMNGSGKNRIYYKPGKGGTQDTQLRRARSYPATLETYSNNFKGFLKYN